MYINKSPTNRVLKKWALESIESRHFVIFNVEDDDTVTIWVWLKGCLPSSMYDTILKVQVVKHMLDKPCADLWIKYKLGEDLKHMSSLLSF